jgi:hypothetical protein
LGLIITNPPPILYMISLPGSSSHTHRSPCRPSSTQGCYWAVIKVKLTVYPQCEKIPVTARHPGFRRNSGTFAGHLTDIIPKLAVRALLYYNTVLVVGECAFCNKMFI